MMEGKVWKFGDDIDTDIILPGRYLIYTDEERLSQHCMEGLDSEFPNKVDNGDFIVAGKNFGCGSSREHAPIAIKGCGIRAVIAESFARIFYRNSTNVGLTLIEAPGISQYVKEGDKIQIDMDTGVIIAGENRIEFKKLPPFMMGILEEGGLINYLKKNPNIFSKPLTTHFSEPKLHLQQHYKRFLPAFLFLSSTYHYNKKIPSLIYELIRESK